MHSVIILVAHLVVAVQSNWCAQNVECKKLDPTKGVDKAVTNPMCIYKQTEELLNDGQCTNMTEKMADEYIAGAERLQRLWLALHNTLRNKVAGGELHKWPPAAGMKQLVWDKSLAAQAKRFNFQCNHFEPWCSKNPNFKAVYFTHMFTGDLKIGTEYSSDPETVTKGFIDGLIRRNRNLSYPADDGGYLGEHRPPEWQFMEIFYGKASKIGASYVDGRWRGEPFVQITTFYGEDGNYSKFYKQGESCSRCPQNYECNKTSRYPHLCVKPGYEYHDDRQYVIDLPALTWLTASSSATMPDRRHCSVIVLLLWTLLLMF